MSKKKERMKEKRELYEKYDSVKRWRNGVVNNTSGSSQTKMKHLNFLIKICESIGMNPDEMIERRIEDLQSTDPLIRNRFEDLITGLVRQCKEEKRYYIGREISTCAKSFFFHNHLPLTITSPKIKDPKTYTPRKEAIERFYQMAKPGDERARISVVFQSLMRRGSVPFLKYRHIKQEYEAGVIPIHIHLEAEEVKGEYFAYDTFIGKQAIEDLRLSLEQRKRGTKKIPPEKIVDESPLFKKENTKEIEPLDETGLTAFYVAHSKRIGLDKEEKITPQALRRAGNTIVEKSKTMPQTWLDLIEGHRPKSAQGKHYTKPSIEELREVYAKAEPFLTLKLSSNVETLLSSRNSIEPEPPKEMRISEMKTQTKTIDKLTDEEIKDLYEKNQQVQQSLSAYFNLSLPTTESLVEKSYLKPESQENKKDLAKVHSSASTKVENSTKCEGKKSDNLPNTKKTVVSREQMSQTRSYIF